VVDHAAGDERGSAQARLLLQLSTGGGHRSFTVLDLSPGKLPQTSEKSGQGAALHPPAALVLERDHRSPHVGSTRTTAR
jgi:hypothetical protein